MLLVGFIFEHNVRCEVVLASLCAVVFIAILWMRVAFLTMKIVTKLFYSTRLETRTKESNTCANSWVVKLVGTMKVIIEMLALVAD